MQQIRDSCGNSKMMSKQIVETFWSSLFFNLSTPFEKSKVAHT